MSASGIVNEKGSAVTFARETTANSTTGSQLSSAWSTFATLTGWLQPVSSRERASYSQRDIEITHKLYLASDPAVVEGDRATIGGVTYRVVSASLDQAGVGEVWKVLLIGDA